MNASRGKPGSRFCRISLEYGRIVVNGIYVGPGDRLGALFIILALFGGVSPARAVGLPHRPKSAYRTEVIQLVQLWRAALMTGDVGRMNSLLATDYVGISFDGSVNSKSQQLDRLRNRESLFTRFEIVNSSVRLSRNVAIVRMRAAILGASGAPPLAGQYLFTMVCLHVGKGIWEITNIEVEHVLE